MAPGPALDPRDRNNALGFKAVDDLAAAGRWSAARTLATKRRLAFCRVTESGGGYVYANDGSAFPAAGRTAWTDDLKDQGRDTPELRARIRAALRVSLSLPHDKVGTNGGSVGPEQQLPDEYLTALLNKPTSWWQPMIAAMDPYLSARLFAMRVTVTTSSVYGGATFPDPVIADVLTVQRPRPEEAARSGHYSLANLARADRIVTDPRYFTDHPKG